MKWNFLYPNYSCVQNPWLGGLPPPDPRSLCPLSSIEFVEPPPEQNSWVRHWYTATTVNMLNLTQFLLTHCHFITSHLPLTSCVCPVCILSRDIFPRPTVMTEDKMFFPILVHIRRFPWFRFTSSAIQCWVLRIATVWPIHYVCIAFLPSWGYCPGVYVTHTSQWLRGGKVPWRKF